MKDAIVIFKGIFALDEQLWRLRGIRPIHNYSQARSKSTRCARGNICGNNEIRLKESMMLQLRIGNQVNACLSAQAGINFYSNERVL